MFKMKKILATLLAVAMMASIGSTVMASETGTEMAQTPDANQAIETRISNCPNACGLPLSTETWYSNYTGQGPTRYRYRYTKKVCNFCGFATPILTTELVYG